MLASLVIFGQDRVLLASSTQTAALEKSWIFPKESAYSPQSEYCDFLYIQPSSVDTVLLKMGKFSPAFWPF